MKRLFIAIAVWCCFANLSSQEYYYWYKGEKLPMELLPTKKFIWVNSEEDTLQLKERLIEKGIRVHPFETDIISNGLKDKFTDRESDCWTILESNTVLPDLTGDEAILYEAPFFLFKGSEVALSHWFYVWLKQDEDLSILKKLAEENKVLIYGNNIFRHSWYILACTKESKGNAMQMANLFHETGLFEWSEPEFISFDLIATNKFSPDIDEIRILSANAADITVNSPSDFINYVEISGITGKRYFNSAYPGVATVNINLSGAKGILIFRIRLQSGRVVCRKVPVK